MATNNTNDTHYMESFSLVSKLDRLLLCVKIDNMFCFPCSLVRFIFHISGFSAVRTAIANGFSRKVYRFCYLILHWSIIWCRSLPPPSSKNAMLFYTTLKINLPISLAPICISIAYFCVATRQLADNIHTDMRDEWVNSVPAMAYTQTAIIRISRLP